MVADVSPKSSRRRSPIDVFKYLDYRRFLRDFYEAKKQQGYSYRSFARAARLGAPNYLKLVVDGKRSLTPTMARRFSKACGLGPEAEEYFVALVELNQAKTREAREANYLRLRSFRRYRRAQRLEMAQADYHATWYLPAIRELVSSPDFREDPEWIAQTLWPPIKPKEAFHAISTLLKLGLLQRDGRGRLRQSSAVVSTGAETEWMHIRRYHAEMMRRATEAMELVPSPERDISSLTVCTSRAGLKRIKERLQEFRRELIELAEASTPARQVVQINFQLFPLSRRDGAPNNAARDDAGGTK